MGLKAYHTYPLHLFLERRVELPKGASPTSESDYSQKSNEFRLSLKVIRGRQEGRVICIVNRWW